MAGDDDITGVVPGGGGEMMSPSREQSIQRSDSRMEYSRESSFSGNTSGGDSEHVSARTKAERLKRQAAAEALVKAAAVGGGKSITFVGGVAFLINNVTGGGMVLFPQVFQQAGWLVTLLALLSIIGLATACGFMLIEAMAMMPGNKRFERRAEYTSITKHYLPKKLYWVSQFFFNASLMANGTSSQIRIHSLRIAEAVDISDMWGESTVFGEGVYAVPLGWFVTMCVVLPLGMVNLDDNIFVQKGGFVAVMSIVLVWIGLFLSNGLDMSRVPAVGSNFTSVLGVVVFNFAMITSIPSWVNEKKPSVSIEKSFGVSMSIAACIFMFLGLFGGMAFPPFQHGQTILVVIYGLGTKLAKITFFLFPACVNLTSIPVFSIMQRYNLVESGVCGKKMALFIAVCVPWMIAIPLYTGNGYELLVTWSGILITSVVNFVVPPILYLLALKSVEKRELERKMTMKSAAGALSPAAAGGGEGSKGELSEGGGLTAAQVATLDSSGTSAEPTRISSTGAGVADSSTLPPSTGGSAGGGGGARRLAGMARKVTTKGPNMADVVRQAAAAQKSASRQSGGESEGEAGGGSSAARGVRRNSSQQPVSAAGAGAATPGADGTSRAGGASVGFGRRLSLLASSATALATNMVKSSKKKKKEKAAAKALELKKKARAARKKQREAEPEEPELDEPALEAYSPFRVPPSSRGQWRRIVWGCMLPFAIGMHYTVPHAATLVSRSTVTSPLSGLPVVSKWRLGIWGTLSVLSAASWTIALAYLLLWAATLVTDGIPLHPFLMGLFILGFGLRVPALLAEVRGYRAGAGDLNRVFMNNVLQIVLCVPLPWFIHHAMHGGEPVRLYSGTITVLTLSLFIQGALVTIILKSYEWILDRHAIVPLLAVGAFFYIESPVLDYGILLHLKPECLS